MYSWNSCKSWFYGQKYLAKPLFRQKGPFIFRPIFCLISKCVLAAFSSISALVCILLLCSSLYSQNICIFCRGRYSTNTFYLERQTSIGTWRSDISLIFYLPMNQVFKLYKKSRFHWMGTGTQACVCFSDIDYDSDFNWEFKTTDFSLSPSPYLSLSLILSLSLTHTYTHTHTHTHTHTLTFSLSLSHSGTSILKDRIHISCSKPEQKRSILFCVCQPFNNCWFEK
jgi:hypothetical protein